MNAMKSSIRRPLLPSASLVVRLGFLAWMLGITFLYWLLYNGPLSGRILSHLAILRWGRAFLQQFLTAPLG